MKQFLNNQLFLLLVHGLWRQSFTFNLSHRGCTIHYEPHLAKLYKMAKHPAIKSLNTSYSTKPQDQNEDLMRHKFKFKRVYMDIIHIIWNYDMINLTLS